MKFRKALRLNLLILLCVWTYFFHKKRELPKEARPLQAPPVVQVFWLQDGTLPEYVWKGIARSRANITLLAVGAVHAQDNRPELVSVDASGADLLRFAGKYQPWGLAEPWERHNTERYFVLRDFMKEKDWDVAMYVDSDVVVLEPMSLPEKCDAVVSLQGDKPNRMKWETTDWVVFAGTSILTRQVLDEFLAFVDKMYDEPYLEFLRVKRDKAPYVCDMTLWYLYAGSASPTLAKLWEWPAVQLPPTPERRLCDGWLYGFDHQHGHLRENGKGLKTLHYQGGEKQNI